jgi:hypothetical protein
VRSREGFQRPCLYPVLARALRQPAWQRPRWRNEQVGGVRCQGQSQRLELASQTACMRARVHMHAGVHEGVHMRMPRSRPYRDDDNDLTAGMANA